jgi:Zn-finger nucleic acid-binding protein
MSEIRRHLDTCAGCRGEWEELAGLKRVLASARAPHVPPGFWEALHRRIREQHGERCRRRERSVTSWWQRAPALIGGAAAVVAAILTPLSASLDVRDAPTMDTRAVLARHATYCSQLPLNDRRSMDYIAAEARAQEPD